MIKNPTILLKAHFNLGWNPYNMKSTTKKGVGTVSCLCFSKSEKSKSKKMKSNRKKKCVCVGNIFAWTSGSIKSRYSLKAEF